MRRLLFCLLLMAGVSPAVAQMPLLGFGTGSFGSAAPGPMTSPVMTSSSTTSPSTTALNFGRVATIAATNSWGATAATVGNVWPTAGTFSNLEVYFPTAPGAAASTKSFDIGMAKGGTKQTLVCNMLETAQTCADSSHSFTVAAGDLITWFVCPSNGTGCTAGAAPTTQGAAVQISATFTSTAAQEGYLIGGGGSPSVVNGTANYMGFGGNFSPNATENIVSVVMPTAGTIDQLYVSPSNTPSPGTMAFVVFKNGAAAPASCTPGTTCLGCTISANAQCTDTNTGHSFTVAQGDTISIQSTPASSATSRAYVFGVRWVPTTANQAIMTASAATVPTTATTRFMGYNGTVVAQATETVEWSIVPFVSGNMTVGHLTIAQSSAPGGVTTRVVTLRAGAAGAAAQASQSPACTITSAATTCTDTNTYAATSGQALNWQTVPTGTNAGLSYFKVGATVTIP